MGIYTKKGDKGFTSLGSGLRVRKDSVRVNAYGTVDELNAVVGIAYSVCFVTKKKYAKYLGNILKQIQDDLFSIGSYLSNPANAKLIDGLATQTLEFEKNIDEMTEKMPELANFILPTGTLLASDLQLARAVSRRAERAIVTLAAKEKVNENVLQYVNRLSDLFFTMSRFANHSEKVSETIWKRR